MAHSLARYARQIQEDVFWIEDSPPPLWKLCISTLLIFINEILVSLSKKKKKLNKILHYFRYFYGFFFFFNNFIFIFEGDSTFGVGMDPRFQVRWGLEYKKKKLQIGIHIVLIIHLGRNMPPS